MGKMCVFVAAFAVLLLNNSWAQEVPCYPDCTAGFQYPDFSLVDGLTLTGSAGQVGNVLRLTPDLTYQAGSAFFTQQQNVASGFTTSFSFQLTHSGPIADGIWFGIQNDGLVVPPPLAVSNTASVEFDTFQNIWDPNGNHVAVISCGPDSTLQGNTADHSNGCTVAIAATLPITLADGNVHTATIEYVPGSLTISLDEQQVLSVPMDLPSRVRLNNGTAWVGFSTTTGAYSENNDVLAWLFQPHLYSAFVQQPINSDGTSTFKATRGVVPVKFTLAQNTVPTCTLPDATIAVTRTAGGTLGVIDENTYIANADTGSYFRIDQTACQYIYNLAVASLGVAVYSVEIKINGWAAGNAVFALK